MLMIKTLLYISNLLFYTTTPVISNSGTFNSVQESTSIVAPEVKNTSKRVTSVNEDGFFSGYQIYNNDSLYTPYSIYLDDFYIFSPSSVNELFIDPSITYSATINYSYLNMYNKWYTKELSFSSVSASTLGTSNLESLTTSATAPRIVPGRPMTITITGDMSNIKNPEALNYLVYSFRYSSPYNFSVTLPASCTLLDSTFESVFEPFTTTADTELNALEVLINIGKTLIMLPLLPFKILAVCINLLMAVIGLPCSDSNRLYIVFRNIANFTL